MARYAATQNAIEKGLDQVSPDAGVKLVDDWIEQLQGVDKPGAVAVAKDLERLKAELARETPREANVLKIVGKLGGATTRLADKAEGTNGDKLRALGEALTGAGHPHDDEGADEAQA